MKIQLREVGFVYANTLKTQGLAHNLKRFSVSHLFSTSEFRLNDPEEACEAAWTVATECTRLAKAARIPRLWDESARLVNEIFGEAASWHRLNEQGEEYSHGIENALYLICYAGASLHVMPKDALRIQLGILPALDQ